MTALFSKAANSAIRSAILVIVIIVIGVPVMLMIHVRTPYVTGQTYTVDQPVTFDHRHHSGDDGIDCRYCHNQVERSAYAGIPSTSLCMGCHNQIWNDSAMIEPLRRSYYSGRPLPWNKVHDLPDFVYFDHSVHVTQGVGCVTCHGQVERMANVYQVTPLTMGWCIECHRNPAPHLRPPEHITNSRWTPDGDASAIGAAVADSFGIEAITYCTACHR